MSASALPRRGFLATLAAGLAAGRLRAAEAEGKPRKPNVLVIVADDLGYADIGVHGCKDIPTPHIDSLAAGGVRFTNGYVTCPVCSPTRAGLTTGRYQQRFGHEFNTGPAPEGDVGLPLTETTFADRMKAAGYATGMVGKWHLGAAAKFHPLRRGFGEFFGFLGGAHSYTNLAGGRRGGILRGTEPANEQDYLTDAFAREAVAFIGRHEKEPFFLYLTFNAVHNPLQAPAKYLDRFPTLKGNRRTYAAMLSAMDDGIGAVLKKLRDAGIEQNTLIFFISDNGGPPRANASSNGALRASKGTVYEGGIRVPFIIQWKAQLPGGRTFDQPVISLDILPTALAAGGAPVPPEAKLDGVDLLPFVKGEKATAPHGVLFWRFGAQAAARKGNWKFVQPRSGASELYDLAADVGESKNLAAEKPDVLKDLSDAWAKWHAELKDPLWGGRQRERPRARAKGKAK
ncbi:MAG: sulfatase [Planctomycetes bacterium]|nr:sulfatase [Planctomycetota bacterium]